MPRGGERLRLTPSPAHDDAMFARLAAGLVDCWQTLGIRMRDQWDPALLGRVENAAAGRAADAASVVAAVSSFKQQALSTASKKQTVSESSAQQPQQQRSMVL